MPSIKVTPTKGLFQVKGTSAIPNGSLSGHKRVVLDKGADYTLTVADSGKIITLSEAGVTTITLPSVSASKGCNFSIVTHTAQNHIVAAASAIMSMVSANATATEYDHAFTSAELSAGAIGDRFEISSDGTFWVVNAFTNAAVTANA
jgi:hypothetical protein